MKEKFGSNRDVAVIYYYWEYDQQELQTMTNFMASLLNQVAEFRNTPFLPLEIYFDTRGHRRLEHEQKGRNALENILFELIEDTFKTCNFGPNVYILLDGLDECKQDLHEEMKNFITRCILTLRTTRNSEIATIKVLATSRPHPPFVQNLIILNKTISTHVEISAHEDDIKNFVAKEVERRNVSHYIDPQLTKDIIEKVGSNVDGMYARVMSVLMS